MAMPGITARGGERRSRGRQSAIEQEVRRELARELHDRVAQTLTGMLVDVENFKTQQVDWDDVVRQMDTVQTSTRQVLSSLRQLLHDLRGEDMFSDGLVQALTRLIERFEEKTSITAMLDVDPAWPDSLTAPASLNLYRIVEEALANVRRHSGASTVRVTLESRNDGELAIVVADDGRGIDSDNAGPAGHGTIGMSERVVILGGRLQITGAAGVGTSVQAVIPKTQVVSARALDSDDKLIIQGAFK